MRLLVTGASGMLGYRLMRIACGNHEVWGSYHTFPVSVSGATTFAMDLMDEGGVKKQVTQLQPEAIVHTAALTDVDACEKDRHRAERVNTHATRWLAGLAGELGARLVYISTDYVFDGAQGNYVETDPPLPINVYGETKLLGEEAALALCPRTLIVRTSIYGANLRPKPGPVEYVIDSLKNGNTIRRFRDQFSSPIYAGDLSRIILEMVARGCVGLFHVGGGEKISRYEFALAVANVFGLPKENILPVPFEQTQGLACRPKDSSLFSEKMEATLGVTAPRVRDGLKRLKGNSQASQNGIEKNDRRN